MVSPSPGHFSRTTRRTDTGKVAQQLHLGQPSSPQSTTKIRERVIQWQSEWTTDDDEAVANTRYGEGKRKIEPETKYKLGDTSTTAIRKEAKDQSLDDDLRNASAPKKRVISDEHWKKDRLSPDKTTPKVAPETPDTKLSAKTTPQFARTDPLSKKYDAWVRVRPRPKKSPKTSEDDSREDVPLPVLQSQHRGSPVPKEKPNVEHWLSSVASSTDEGQLEEIPLSKKGARTKTTSQDPRSTRAPKQSPVETNRLTKSKPAQGKRYINATSEDDRRMNERNPPSHEDISDVFRDDELPILTPPPVRGNRIEAWLTSSGNPFRVGTTKQGASPDDIEPTKQFETSESHLPPSEDPFGNAPLSDGESQCVSPTLGLRRSGARRNFSPPKRTQFTPLARSDNAGAVPSTLFGDGPAKDASAGRKDYTSSHLGVRTNLLHIKTANGHLDGGPASPPPELEVVREGQSEQFQDSKFVHHFLGRPGPKRKLTSHADLVSVLSLPRTTASIQSARSLRTTRRKRGSATISDIMSEVRSDESKYLRELHTLVDGVIPVLLNCVMSKSQSGLATQLLGQKRNDADVTAPIIKMGIALERLKSAHERISVQSPDALLLWSQGAHRIYADYIQAWRLGFQDVVINLAPSEQAEPLGKDVQSMNAHWNDSLPRNNEGYVVNGDGERVDVAFLLKRPLIRLRYLARSLEGIHHASGSSQAKIWTGKFQELVNEARKKQEQERARLEDEAASSIDTSRAREPQTLVPLAGIHIDPHRSVRARDFFDLKLQHSNGQQIDCRVELFLRDEHDGSKVEGGDVLICEVDSASRWLLFPPVQHHQISARNGDLEGEIVVMIRGTSLRSGAWHEMLSLRSEDEQTGFDWVHMLGLVPVPPSVHTPRNTAIQSNLYEPKGQKTALATPSPVAASNTRDQIFTSVSNLYIKDHLGDHGLIGSNEERKLDRPLHVRTSSTPSRELPIVPKTRTWSDSGERKPEGKSGASPSTFAIKRKEVGTPRSLETQRGRSQEDLKKTKTRPLPQVPLDSTPQLRVASTPQFSQPVDASDGRGSRRRASSPLKHQYEPSSASGDSSASEESSDDDDQSITSESSADDMLTNRLSSLSPLKRQMGNVVTRGFSSSSGPASVSPSQSASQGARNGDQVDLTMLNKTIASIFSWSDRGIWESLFPDECSIVVSPGLIEAFEMNSAHSQAPAGAPTRSNDARPIRVDPLVALELTPLVPLRRGTAIDISIRSPPTDNSQIKSSNNVMFRSRNGQECELLYNMINQARINNPTYIAMQNAHSPHGDSSWAAYMDRRGNKRNPSSWWRFGSRRNSYRSKGSKPQSLAQTESTVATMSTAISALKRYSTNGSRMFNVGKSTVTSQGPSERSASSFTSSSGASTPMVDTFKEELSLGISNAKIRLYQRESASKWQDKGPARLTIMHPPQQDANMSPSRLRLEKRIVVVGKSHDQPLLDVTLGETSFERVARTGIAVSVWERLVGPNGEVGQVAHTGGVVGTRVKVYMIQMKSEAETAYTFSLVGRLRY